MRRCASTRLAAPPCVTRLRMPTHHSTDVWDSKRPATSYLLSSYTCVTSNEESVRPKYDRLLLRAFLQPAGILLLILFASHAVFAASSLHKEQARSQYETAERMREALNGRPPQERTRRDYQRVAEAYRKVYYLSPASSKADASVVAVAEILAEMGRQFSPDEKELRAAIGEYEFLRREYPGSKYRFQALFTIGQIYKEDLGDNDAARETFEEFLKHYPRQALAPQARQALTELNLPSKTKEVGAGPVAHEEAPSPAETTQDVSLTRKAPTSTVTGIRHWSTPDYTRVAIDVDGEVKYQAGRVPDPDRIFFDLPDTRLASTLVGKSFDVEDGFLKKIRVAQYQRGATRVVLEVDDVSDYSAFLLPNPYRLIIDIHGRQPHILTAQKQAAGEGTKNAATAKARPEAAARPIPKRSGASDVGGSNEARSDDSLAATAPQKKLPRKVIVSDDDTDPASQTPGGAPSQSTGSVASGKSPGKASDRNTPTRVASSAPPDDLLSSASAGKSPEVKATAKPTTSPTAVNVAPRTSGKKSSQEAVPMTAQEVREASPTSSGERSLTRTLGLKIGRIVIDAGHGGHDTGTIGPAGLQEKDLVLDVSLRLGRLLETRLGAEVIYTRDDDTFVPLETRTALANEHQADLFISIHANSSADSAARGVETYYLNFTSNPEALEVAARENAVSAKSIHELQDLVKKITLKDKIDESRELASDIQASLYAGLSAQSSAIRNRGVKKAPFIVLIGANMPSILAEISFVSNPTDEKKLETAAYRQRIAESLYKGITKYAEGLSGVKIAAKFAKDSSR